MVPEPPKIEVPPMKTEAMTTRSEACPCVVVKFSVSMVRNMPARPASAPMSVNSFSRVALTSMPTTRATVALSPMKSSDSPKRWRLRMNHNSTAMARTTTAWIGMPSGLRSTTPLLKSPVNRRPVVIAQRSVWLKSRSENCLPPARNTAMPRLDLLGRAPFRQPVQPEHVVEAVEGREDHARERDDRGKGKIDLARRDDQREAERADDLWLVVDHDGDVGAPAEEGVGRQRHQRDQHDDQHQQDRHALGRQQARDQRPPRRRTPPCGGVGGGGHVHRHWS